MTKPFASSFAKLARARLSIEELDACLDAYGRNEPVVSKLLPDGDGVVIDTEWKGLGEAPAANLGDAVDNLRGALDLMATALVRANKADPKKVRFPFAESKKDLDNQIKAANFDRAGPHAVKLLKKFAPYRGGATALCAIHDFIAMGRRADLIQTPTATSLSHEIRKTATGFELTTRHGPIKFLFAEGSPLQGQEVVPALRESAKVVEDVLQGFAELLASRG